MNLMKCVFTRLFRRWMNNNGVSEEDLDSVLRNTFSPKDLQLWSSSFGGFRRYGI